MRLIGLAVTLVLSFLLAPLAAPAQQPPRKTARIGFLGDVPLFLDELFGPWAKWAVIGYGVALVGVLVGAFFVRLYERRRR